MQVVPSGGQICNQCKWRHLVDKFGTNASGAIWWTILQLMQVAPSGGQICNQCKWRHLVAKIGTNACDAIWWTILQLMQIAPSQVIDSIPWVRCASGNVYDKKYRQFFFG